MNSNLLPPRTTNEKGEERRVGIEVELAGLTGQQLAQCVADAFGGEIQQRTRFEINVADTDIGDFTVELDSSYLKKLQRAVAENPRLGEEGEEWLNDLESFSSDLLTRAAQQFVPWEVVSPPIPLSRLEEFNTLSATLRELGALGTRHSVRFAFGLHLNPELPALDSAAILAYLRAFLCLYDWIVERERIDLSRRLTPYINHFSHEYMQLVMSPDYAPDLGQLMDDYLQANPSRNRSLDLLPLFAHLDEERLQAVVQDERVNARPTLHYRLPNCDIDNPDWNLMFPWCNWLQVERLAGNEKELRRWCSAYREELDRWIYRIDNSNWLQQTSDWIDAQHEVTA